MLGHLRTLLRQFPGHGGKLVLSQVLLLVSVLAQLGVGALVEQLIDQGIARSDIEATVDVGIWMLVLAVVAALSMAGTAALGVYFSQGVAYLLRTRVYDVVQGFSFQDYDRIRTGDVLVRLNADVVNVQNAVLYGTILVLYAPFMVVAAIALSAATVPGSGTLMMVVIALVLGLMLLLVPPIFRAYDERQRRLDELNSSLQETVAGVRVVKAFVREGSEAAKLGGRADAMRRPAYRAAFRVAVLVPLLAALAQAARAAVVWAGGSSALEGSGITLGEINALAQYLALIITPLALTAVVIPYLLRGDTSARRLTELATVAPAVTDPERPAELRPDQVQGRIAFEGVSFAFRRPDGELDPPALRNIDLTIEPGQRVGFLGATGAGKTALVNLVPRFYDVTEGRITIDGVDVRHLRQEDLRRIVGIALQEAVLFQGDIRTNLKFGAPEVDDEVMVAAALASDAHGFVTNLPEGWSAAVSRRGNNFSGGQRQRLSIARALVPGPRILILDDSTSAADVATEARIQAAIPELATGVTTLYVAQRISAVIDLDLIVLLDAGEIVDMGSHDELLARCELYREIYRSQLGALPDDVEVTA